MDETLMHTGPDDMGQRDGQLTNPFPDPSMPEELQGRVHPHHAMALDNLSAPQHMSEEELDKFHFKNIIDEISQEDMASIRKKIWPEVKRGRDSNKGLKGVYANIVKLLAAKVPMPQDSMRGQSSSDSFIKNSGSNQLWSSSLLEGLMSLAITAISILFLGDKKFKAKVASHLKMKPGMEEVIYRGTAWYENYFCKGLLPGYKEEFTKSIVWGFLSGDGLRKVFDDPSRGSPTSGHILPGDYFFTQGKRNFYDLKGFVHRYLVSREEMDKKVESGEWDSVLAAPFMYEEEDEVLYEATLQMGGREKEDDDEYQEDEYEVFEYYNELAIPSDPLWDESKWKMLPYRVVLGDEGRIVGVYRNWQRNDPLRFAINDFVHYNFLFSLDEYSYGLAHVGGQKVRAATVLQRQLLDSAQLANTSTGFIRPSGRITDQTFDLKSGKFFVLPAGDEDVTKSVSYMPYNPPNQVVFQLLQKLEDDVKKFSHVVNEQMINLATQAPAASVLAVLQRLEQLPNAILQGIYDSFSKEMRIYKRKFYEWFPPHHMFQFEWDGEIIHVCKEDFSPGIDYIPCGDFSMESDAYRLMRAQLILDQAEKLPQFHNLPYVLKSFYKDLGQKDEDIQQIVVDPNAPKPPPPPSDPSTENSNLMTGQPVKAYIDQDHKAHMTVHSLLLQHQDQNIQAAVHAHMQEHAAMKMQLELYQAAGLQMPPDASKIPPQVQNQLAQALAQGASKLDQQKKAENPAPIDPGLIGWEEVKAMREKTKIDAELEMKRIAMEKEKTAAKVKTDMLAYQADIQKMQHEAHIKEMQFKADQEKELFERVVKGKELEIKQKNLEIQNLKNKLDFQKDVGKIHLDHSHKIIQENNKRLI
jgi:hypothetical protein